MKELSPADSPAVTARSFALTIPRVTVPLSPSGEPIAITESPTATLSLSPKVSAVSPVLFTLRTAKSYEESRPMIVACRVVPSLS